MSTASISDRETGQGLRSRLEPNRWRRWLVFLTVLALSLAIGLALVYGREARYRASATLLTVKPKAVDTPSEQADLEHVTIQARLLLGDDLLQRLSMRLLDGGDAEVAHPDVLRGMLSVMPIPETNLLELRAEGRLPERLKRIVDHWAESYEAERAEEVAALSDDTAAELQDRQGRLARQVEDAHAELRDFRERYDIVSLERSENRPLASLNGLNASLNKARERLVEAKASLRSIDAAIARGELVAPSDQTADLTRMRLAVERARDRLDRLRGRYTDAYIRLDPSLRDLPDDLANMERALQRATEIGRITARDEARRQVEAARDAEQTLSQQLERQQREAQVASQRLRELAALEEGAKRLETLYADNRERLAQIQARNLAKYPPIKVVEWGHIPTRPVYPDYERDLLIMLAVVLLVALFVTWLVEYLSDHAGPRVFSYTGVLVDPAGRIQVSEVSAGQEPIEHRIEPIDLLSGGADSPSAPDAEDPLRELSLSELQRLLEATDRLTRGYCALLLSGLAPSEMQTLDPECFDPMSRSMRILGPAARVIALTPEVWDLIVPVLDEQTLGRATPAVAELDERLLEAARSAGLADPAGVMAEAIWTTYVLFLCRQGVDQKRLQLRVGSLSPQLRPRLAAIAPPTIPLSLTGVEWVYPALSRLDR